MHRSEERQLTRCAECDTEIDPGRERGFGLGGGGALCYECALRRGGRYDEVQDRWVEEPQLGGLGREFE
jgi:recombinational DNA repair protein (RecF pathway)